MFVQVDHAVVSSCQIYKILKCALLKNPQLKLGFETAGSGLTSSASSILNMV